MLDRRHGSRSLGWRAAGCLALVLIAAASSSESHGASPDLPSPAPTLRLRDFVPNPEPAAPAAGALRLPLPEALSRGLHHNKALAVRRLDPAVAASQADAERGVFDYFVTLDARADGTETPTGSQLEGAMVSDVEGQTVNIGVERKFETGTVVSTRLLNRRFGTNSIFQLVNPQYTSNLVVDIVQPLARDAGRRTNRAALDSALHAVEQGRQRLRKVTLDTLAAVESAYWELAFARQDRAVKRAAHRTALSLVEHDQLRLREGQGSAAEVVEALTASANRAADVAAADRQVADAEEILRRLIGLTDRRSSIPIEPVATVPKLPAQPELEQALAGAFRRRPEYHEALIELKRRDIRLAFLRNQVRPRIDLVATYGQNGLSTSFGRSLDQVFDRDFQTYLVGVQVELPIQNRAARAEHREGQLLLEQAILALRALEDQIEEEVRRSFRAVESDRQRLSTAQEAEQLSVRQLNFAAKRFEEGLLTNIDLLRFQQDAAVAQSRRLRATADLLKSQVALEAATGSLLESRGIKIDPVTAR